MKNKKEKVAKEKSKYSSISSLVWAIQKLWRLDKWFVFFIFATVPVAVALPLVNSYFSKVLIDRLGMGATFEKLVLLVVAFTVLNIFLNLLDQYIKARCSARGYYPTSVYQHEMSEQEGYYADFENTQKQDFKKIRGYAWRDATRGNCSLEFLWKDLSKTLIDALGIIAYASILVILDPVIIYISHRFASTRFCDRIILLDDGIMKESGTHEELMQLGGQYAYMFGVQSKYYKEGEINA